MNNDTTNTLITPAVRASAPVWLFDDSGRVWSLAEAREYILARVEEDENGCWLWQSSLTKDGYGQITDRSLEATFGMKGAHRLSYFAHTGHKPQGRAEPVMHSCDVRNCCNPDHLSVGTPAENMRQMFERGRANRSFGVNHWKSRVTPEAVREIRARHAAGEGLRSIAASYDIKPATVSSIARRISWRHVD
jgi:hypothetical protein